MDELAHGYLIQFKKIIDKYDFLSKEEENAFLKKTSQIIIEYLKENKVILDEEKIQSDIQEGLINHIKKKNNQIIIDVKNSANSQYNILKQTDLDEDLIIEFSKVTNSELNDKIRSIVSSIDDEDELRDTMKLIMTHLNYRNYENYEFQKNSFQISMILKSIIVKNYNGFKEKLLNDNLNNLLNSVESLNQEFYANAMNLQQTDDEFKVDVSSGQFADKPKALPSNLIS